MRAICGSGRQKGAPEPQCHSTGYPRGFEGQVSAVKWNSCQHGLCLLPLYPFCVSFGAHKPSRHLGPSPETSR
ncbi:hypothetical protein OJAV_G00157940 [Oryzias javanicus]|uniref:Uncharacterized protein n=1 Tax=Oryzias javanicus TaxID=123683 RepID=A0A437CIL5_ORYJA|nr:hypothetical protein OJAV_G00157940 [Oryzias javanicus]